MMSCCGKCTTRVTWCYMQELTFILQVWPKASLKNWPTSVYTCTLPRPKFWQQIFLKWMFPAIGGDIDWYCCKKKRAHFGKPCMVTFGIGRWWTYNTAVKALRWNSTSIGTRFWIGNCFSNCVWNLFLLPSLLPRFYLFFDLSIHVKSISATRRGERPYVIKGYIELFMGTPSGQWLACLMHNKKKAKLHKCKPHVSC